MKNQERPTVTLTFPLVEIPKDKSPWEADAYSELGIFFVKNSEGIYYIVDVCKKEGSVPETILPPAVCNQITTQLVERKQESLFEKIQEQIDEHHTELMALLLEAKACKQHMFEEILETVASEHAKTRDDLAAICSSNTSTAQPSKGYISEEALVQLVKEIKK